MLRGDDALYDAALATLDRLGRPVREAVHIERVCAEHEVRVLGACRGRRQDGYPANGPYHNR